MIKENVAWPLSFIQALSTGPNVAVAGNDGRVEKAMWRITAGTKMTLRIDVAHLQVLMLKKRKKRRRPLRARKRREKMKLQHK